MRDFAFLLVRFGAVGLASNAALYGAFLVLLMIGVVPVFATGMVYVTGTVLNYILHRHITFADKKVGSADKGHGNDPWRFGAAYAAGLIVSLGGMAVLGPIIGPEIAQLGVILSSAVTIFTILHLTGFGAGEHSG